MQHQPSGLLMSPPTPMTICGGGGGGGGGGVGRRSPPSFMNTQQQVSSPATGSGVGATQLTTSGIDEKSLKDVVRVVDKRIGQLNKLTEFSQVLQVDNISNRRPSQCQPFRLVCFNLKTKMQMHRQLAATPSSTIPI